MSYAAVPGEPANGSPSDRARYPRAPGGPAPGPADRPGRARAASRPKPRSGPPESSASSPIRVREVVDVLQSLLRRETRRADRDPGLPEPQLHASPGAGPAGPSPGPLGPRARDETTADGRFRPGAVECLGNCDECALPHGRRRRPRSRRPGSGSTRSSEACREMGLRHASSSGPSPGRRLGRRLDAYLARGRLRSGPPRPDGHDPGRDRRRGPQSRTFAAGAARDSRPGLKWSYVPREDGRAEIPLRQRRRRRAGDVQGPGHSPSVPHRLLEGMLIAACAVGIAPGLHLCPRRI